MTRNNTLGKLLAMSVAVVLLALVPACDSPHDSGAQESFPEMSGTRVELPAREGEEIRYVYFKDDRVTKTLTQIEYRSGITSYIFYRDDGSQKEVRSYFPRKQGAPARQLNSIVIFHSDGAAYLSHQVFREDGSLARTGGRLADGSYQTLYLRADSGEVERRLVFNSKKELEEESRYNDRGVLVEKSERVSSYQLKTSRYSDDGVLLSEIYDSEYGSRNGKLYFEDGKTVKVEFEYRTYGLVVEYFDKNGNITTYVEYEEAGMIVTHFAANGNALYKQFFEYVNGKWPKDGTFKLVRVEEHHKWSGNGRYSYELKRAITMSDDGKTPMSIETPVSRYSYERTVEELRPDGSASKVTRYNSSNRVVSETEHGPGERRPSLNKDMFNEPGFEPLDIPDAKIKPAEESAGEGQEY